MAEPLVRTDGAGEGVLADAGHRLERALQALEAVIGQAQHPAPRGAAEAQVVELDTVRRRSRELEAAAGEAAQALGRAMAEVRQALQEDDLAHVAQPSLFDGGALDEDPFDSALESGAGLPDEDGSEADESPSGKEPAA